MAAETRPRVKRHEAEGLRAAASITSQMSMPMRWPSIFNSFTSAMLTQRKIFSRSLVISAACVELTGITLATIARIAPRQRVREADSLRRRLWGFAPVHIACCRDLRARAKMPEKNPPGTFRCPGPTRWGNASRFSPEPAAPALPLFLDRSSIPAPPVVLVAGAAEWTWRSFPRRKIRLAMLFSGVGTQMMIASTSPSREKSVVAPKCRLFTYC